MGKSSFIVLGCALALTLIFHFMLAERVFGIPLAVMTLAGILSIALVLKQTDHRSNRWAYFFLIPLGLTLLAELLHASDVVRGLGFIITAISFTMYAYWISAPQTPFKQLRNLWPVNFFTETMFPFRSFDRFFEGLRGGKEGMKVFVGVLLALPFLLLIGGLFASADPLFHKIISDPFQDVSLADNLGKIVRDAFVLLFLMGSGWMIFTRASEKRPPIHHTTPRDPGQAITTTFLVMINLLFVVFLGFQIAYFFGGENFIREQGLTYAEYARSGFFQLLAVAGVVFGICSLIYHITELKEKMTRFLTGLLIVQTGVVILSAINRLLLYIDAYGLTVSRWWAMASILIIAMVLLFLLLGILGRWTFDFVAKFTFLGTLTLVSALLLVNVEGMVVKINTNRFLSGKTKEIDTSYLFWLSSDAVPNLIAFTKQSSSIEAKNLADSLRANLEKRLNEDWLSWTLSDYLAIKAAARLDGKTGP